ncbi:hypothetical protein FLI74_32085 [Pseudomonas aeruginosa]|uniref:hypothetical protein n=1 Tax=Pseudomonas aeruginosa TaxID=287 RepID=UPI000E30C9E3|nr:hypothetical protein [Pseudomonas aeruginosa]EIU2672014.1 hypothetical protein [Pseudomonas aeruginosa]EKU7999806.1 hypothetical protein [Pseudomonas aeruginosa]EKV2966509.1 hypothetical protein [Pseudomonas aeruginosa]EKV2993490.1 hypothetical protein [Pseudomonas aeruginosa]ELK4766586.1 hypothetical protein [Pseudomonas aeruginosa]
MQVNPKEVSGEKATTPAADLRLVSVEQLQKIHRELDACQKVIWLAGCGQRGYGFDPSYVTGAQEQLQGIEALINAAAPVAQAGQVPEWIEVATQQPEVGQCIVMAGPQGSDAPGRYWRLTGIRREDGYYDANGCGCCDITHWYPLLESPGAIAAALAQGGE